MILKEERDFQSKHEINLSTYFSTKILPTLNIKFNKIKIIEIIPVINTFTEFQAIGTNR